MKKLILERLLLFLNRKLFNKGMLISYMKKIIILILVIIFLTSCSIKEDLDDSKFEEISGNYYVKYENGVLEYNALIEKPTPCHKIIKDEKIMESYPIQVVVDLNIKSSDEICIQVISEEKIEGIINTGHKPGSFTIRLNDEIVYSTNLR